MKRMAPMPKNVKVERTFEDNPNYEPPRPSVAKMAKGLVKAGAQAIAHGRVEKEVREERMDTCRACPLYDAKNKRCRDCGCFMEAKSWIGGNPALLCPQNKWKR